MASERYKISEFPRILEILAEFLQKTPPSSFDIEEFKRKRAFKAPLLLKEDSKERLKSLLQSYPHVYEAGILPDSDHFNFLNAVGQFLTAIEIRLEILELKNPEEFKRHKTAIKEFRKLWGSKSKMNARSLYNRFKGMSTSKAKTTLSKMLQESANKLKDLSDISDI